MHLDENLGAEILEAGDIQFIYRPKVQSTDPFAPVSPGVQAFFFILSPEGRHLHRRIRVGRKRMPASEGGERFWAEVEAVGSLDRVLASELDDVVYATKTRGERFQPGARPIAQGSYKFELHAQHVHFRHHLDHLELDVPDEVRVPIDGANVVLFERHREPESRALWTTIGHPMQLDRAGADFVLVGIGEN
ncbi:MAG: hypothetical protein SFX73_24185 [Kofleriaceae bacterium]|nr:hypothetical protein [Kofleriaceae bacterium]